mgnify:CR=1 FL=1
MGDPEANEDAAKARQHERAAAVEDVLSEVQDDLGRQSYPTTSEALAETYADTPIDLPNETESVGSAFDRIDDRFERPGEAYEALVTEFEEGDLVSGAVGVDAGETRGARAVRSEERAGEEEAVDAPVDDEGIEGERQGSVERAKQAQQEEYENEHGE